MGRSSNLRWWMRDNSRVRRLKGYAYLLAAAVLAAHVAAIVNYTGI